MSGHLDSLNPAQRAAAIARAPVLVLAGAGSGKTETLTRRVADLILHGEPPDRLLCITFTVKAAAELRGRLAALLGPERTPRWVGTFHAIMARLLQEDDEGVPGLPRGFTILGRADAQALLAAAARTTEPEETRQLADAVSLLKNGLAAKPPGLSGGSGQKRFEPRTLARAAAVLPAYQAALEARGVLDFDDLIARPVSAMQADPMLATRWSGRWSEILVDEYQDTNHAQHTLLAHLATSHGRVFAVGDDLQAIYGWRGAEVAHIRRFGRDFPAAPPPLKLETNYRSTPTILRAANAVAAHDCEAAAKTLHPADCDAPSGVAIAIRETRSPEQEGRFAASWVQGLRRRQPALPWRECAILVRAGFVAKPIVETLRAASIPVQLVRDHEPDPPRDVLASIAWLRLAASRKSQPRTASETWDRAADDAFRRACAYPSRGIGRSLFERLRAHATEQRLALAAAVGSLPASDDERRALDAVPAVARAIADAIRGGGLGPEAALRLAARMSGIADGGFDRGTSRLALAWAAAFRAAEEAGSVGAFCDAAALDEAAAQTATPEAVQVMTLHRAKGLEFDHVLLAGLEEGVWPHWQAEAHGTLAEERRLFYVGITRARHSLAMSWVQYRRDWPAKPSQFLDEIPRALTDTPEPKRLSHAGSRPGAAKPPTQAETDRLVRKYRGRKKARSASD